MELPHKKMPIPLFGIINKYILFYYHDIFLYLRKIVNFLRFGAKCY